MDIKIDIFTVILPNVIEEKHQSMVYFSVNIHWNPTLSISPKSYFCKNVLEFENDTKIPATLKLQTSDNGLVVKRISQKEPKPEKALEIMTVHEL